jgi:[ribosomal protein S5]-alanine N-acetyltransferase
MKVEDIFSDLQTLDTERMKLRKLNFEDEQDIFSYCSDEEVSKIYNLV